MEYQQYIKTKYRLFKIDDRCAIDKTADESYGSSTLGIYYISPKDIEGTSDSIEDLCDKFVGIFPDGFYEPNFEEYFIDNLLSEIDKYTNKNDEINIYGAIWTPEGLKYVAKRTRYGSFELL